MFIIIGLFWFINLLVSHRIALGRGTGDTASSIKISMNLGKICDYSEPQLFQVKKGVCGRRAFLIGVMWAVIELMRVVFSQMVLREGAKY